ncbi:hypothetical protein Thiowin_02160 [Thiorhodovibrio winogradskyi]|uniref:Uncharacterized protein n=1 Tax=Thiorhodovibrio winogradskyi TaxID=77007 RepID=A0ABZ0S858_9GAMM|nr:hypothetical protein [Thiorhodovibrio winogradskyi]
MESVEDFSLALGLIDARIAERETALQQVEAAIKETEQGEPATGQPALAADGVEATAMVVAEQLDALRQLRVVVQGREALLQRLGEVRSDLAQGRDQLEALARDGVPAEPP